MSSAVCEHGKLASETAKSVNSKSVSPKTAYSESKKFRHYSPLEHRAMDTKDCLSLALLEYGIIPSQTVFSEAGFSSLADVKDCVTTASSEPKINTTRTIISKAPGVFGASAAASISS